jgi:hypothetical protein
MVRDPNSIRYYRYLSGSKMGSDQVVGGEHEHRDWQSLATSPSVQIVERRMLVQPSMLQLFKDVQSNE